MEERQRQQNNRYKRMTEDRYDREIRDNREDHG